MALFRMCMLFVIFVEVQYSMAKPQPRKINVYNQKSKMFQGDIANFPRDPTKTRNAIISRHWTNNIIPYDDSQLSATGRNLVQRAINRIQGSTCIRFVQRTTQTNYVRFTAAADGCYSSVGMAGGVQDLNLQHTSTGTCLTYDTVVHEMLHAVGLFHEQSRYDRNSYITIQNSNIDPDDRSQFAIASSSITSFHGTSYDFDSVMHYDQFAFSNNGKPTITVNSNIPNSAAIQRKIGTVQDASATDIVKVNKMYNCGNTPVVQTVPPQTSCTDAASRSTCLWYIWRCNDVKVYQNCRKTCNRCTSSSG